MAKRSRSKYHYFNLLLGIAFLSYGCYRLYTFYEGAPYSNFRLIVAVGFVVIGIFDLYMFFKGRSRNE